MGVLEVLELPAHFSKRIFTKGGGGGTHGSHLWTCLEVGFDSSGNPVTSTRDILYSAETWPVKRRLRHI
ncbi:hypothetical protein LDENG_00209280 [Lucifuga dentata]|nr:hypothetical protein LDENG_00209280 [Lucifuga dentata]